MHFTLHTAQTYTRSYRFELKILNHLNSHDENVVNDGNSIVEIVWFQWVLQKMSQMGFTYHNFSIAYFVMYSSQAQIVNVMNIFVPKIESKPSRYFNWFKIDRFKPSTETYTRKKNRRNPLNKLLPVLYFSEWLILQEKSIFMCYFCKRLDWRKKRTRTHTQCYQFEIRNCNM